MNSRRSSEDETGAPLVSVVVPIYNARGYLEQTCRSVAAQTHPNWELLLVDDHSTDGSFELAQRIAKESDRVRVIRTPTNCGGPAGPRNLGVDMARGSFVAFLDADDLWFPTKLAMQLAVLDASGAAISSTQARRFRNEDELQAHGTVAVQPGWSKAGFLVNQVKNRIVTSSVVVRREFLLRHRFNEDRGYRAVEDYDCWLRIIAATGFCAKLEAPLLGYRICDGQISGNKLEMARKVFRVHWNFGSLSARLSAPLLTATHVGLGLFQRLAGRNI